MTMKPEITDYQQWVFIDGMKGVSVYPKDHVPVIEAIEDYGGIEACHEVDVMYGYGARLTMPGYMDSTEYIGPFETEEAAIHNLYELYGDDVDDDYETFCEKAIRHGG